MNVYDVKIYSDGTRYWYKHGKLSRVLHRVEGPAVECFNGDKYWYFNGRCHREDGAAIEYANGTKKWYLEGKKVTEAEFIALKRS